MSVINKFKNEYAFLSNFWPCEVLLGGELYPSVEHAYQAAKTIDYDERLKFQQNIPAKKAKLLGKKVTLRPDWDNIKRGVMIGLLVQKFSPTSEEGQKLLATGNAELIEGNWWGDTYWGVCKGVGENHLGKILMAIRDKITPKSLKLSDKLPPSEEIKLGIDGKA